MSLLSWVKALLAAKPRVDPVTDTLGAATLVWRGGVPAEAVELSLALEGLSLKPYLDGEGGTWTIGYGSTRDLAGKPVTPATPAITQAQAETMAARDLAHAAKLTASAFPQGLPPRWAAAMILMSNNLGDIRTWGPSLKTMVDQKRWGEAAYQMRKYRNQGGKPLRGLIRRRWTEAAYASGYSAAEAKRRAWAEIKSLDDWPRLPGDPRPA
jgi:lysozyme